MLLWWADEYENVLERQKKRWRTGEPVIRGNFKRQYTVTAIALRNGLQRDEISRVIIGYKQLRVEEIILRIIQPYLIFSRSRILRKRWENSKKQTVKS